MSNLTTSRTLFICVVPAVIALISVYWLRKKKKFKGHSDPQTASAQELEKLDSLAECSLDSSTLDSADTLSDASSFASPESSSEKSLRTKNSTIDNVGKNSPFEKATDVVVVKNNVFCNSNSPVTPSQPVSFKMSPLPSSDFQTLNGTKSERLSDGVDMSERCNLLPSLRLGEVTRFSDNFSNEEESASDIFSRLLPNFSSDSMDPMEALEEMLGFSPSSLRIVENGVSHSSDNVARVVAESEKPQTVDDTDSNDSHSSVLDENSLSYVSDDSDRQAAELKNKGSDFDESLCDELDKSPVPQPSAPSVFDELEKNCNPVLLPASKPDASEDLIEEKAIAEVSVSESMQAPATKTPESPVATIDQCPDSSVNGLSHSLGSDSNNTDSPLEPDSSATGSSSVETPPTCDSSSLAKSLVVTSPGPLKLLNGDVDPGAVEDPQIPEMDIAEHLSMKSVPSLSGMENENCSESSGWEMQDSQSDALSKSDDASKTNPDNPPAQYVYEFELPQELCGRLIGKHGKHVKSIKDRTHANVYIKRHPYDPQLKIVVVEGNRSDVSEALEIIRRKYPPSRYPMVTLVKTNMISSTNVLPETLQLHLPEGASCDVILSSLVSGGHFFLQQPTHPTYPSLSTLDQCMIGCYAQGDTPPLPHPVEAGVICAAPVMSGWYRAQVVYVYENEIECELKFVDYGGFSQAPTSSLRQIRSDFMSLPFQASECYLANVRPVDPVEGWSAEATATFEELAQGQILQALLVEYASDGIPCVHLYRVQGISNMFINKELVERGLAVWVNNSHWDPH